MKKKTAKQIQKVTKKLEEAQQALSDLWDLLEEDDVYLDYADGSSVRLLAYVKDDMKTIRDYKFSWQTVLKKLGLNE